MKLSVKQNALLEQIQLVVFDVDGVLTDGRLYYGSQGEESKVFHVRDGVGLKLLADMGFFVAIVTAKKSEMVQSRVDDLGIKNYFSGVKDKAHCVESLAIKLGVKLEEILFVGDDMVDIPAMKLCGGSVAPLDAYSFVKDSVDFVLDVKGGQGVAREVCDLVLKAQNMYERAYHLASTTDFERKR